MVSEICKYIRDNMDKDISLEELANHFGYSKYHLSRKFKQETGYSYKQYLEALKIERSIASIIENDRNVTEVFIESTHESSGTFSNTFKKLTGLSPILYKKSIALLVETLLKAIKSKGEIVYRRESASTGGSVTVEIHYPAIHDERVTFLGLFDNGIPNKAPVVGMALYKQSHCVFNQIPEGQYFLLATEIDITSESSDYFVLNKNYRAKLDQPIVINDDTNEHYTLTMRLATPEDPPIVLNLPNLVKLALLKNKP